jgi:hypothetical protein
MSTYDYTVKNVYDGTVPVCRECGASTRYSAFSFKRFCVEHSHLAESEGGKVGGRKKLTWNRGKTAEEDDRIAKQAEKMSGEGNPFFGRKHSQETRDRISRKKMIGWSDMLSRATTSDSSEYFDVVSSQEEYKTWQLPLRVRCKKCEREMSRCLMDLERGTRCHECFPIGSIAETEIADFVRSLGLFVVQNTRQVIPPKEVDVWVPDKKLAIEHHGLYWHSGGKGGDPWEMKNRHREKAVTCKDAGIRLIQFFSDEWRDKREICESMIANRLGTCKNVIGARELNIVERPAGELRGFFESSHIDGYARSSRGFSLEDVEGPVVALTVRKPIQKKHGNVCEIARLSTRKNTVVPGGASRIIAAVSEWASRSGFEGILSYADLRFGSGDVYSKCGFERIGETGTNYWYTDGQHRFDRFAFRAQDGLSEKEYALSKGVRPVYGSGHAIFVKKL